MTTYTFDNISLLKDGKRWFPTMGEIHYSRVHHQFWEETLCKMKAGGVDIASAYVIWIHHEEIEGEYDWSGDRNLHEFLATAKKCGMKVWLRIGPWSHGEVRNGGFPDWLLHKDFKSRTNDERYFAVVTKWFTEMYAQVRDFIARPGDASSACNPVIGIQIENEYGHVGGLYDETGDEHMKRLTDIAHSIGFEVSLYTATGWGGARTGGLLPVMGGYCDAPWDQRITEIEPSGNYVFTPERNDHNIGSDHGFGYGITFDIHAFPYLTAELGGGLQVTSHRRTIATAKDIAAVALTKMGSGCNLLGYYMYAGGTNPEGKRTTLQESRETGYPNDVPVKSYDFRAPVRESGAVSDTLRELKLLSYFAHDFGSSFCELSSVLPDDNPLDPKNFDHLRYAWRSDGKKGYLFINNYVRHQHLAPRTGLSLSSPDGKTALPVHDVRSGEFFFLPFNMNFSGVEVTASSVTPLCTVGKPENGNGRVIFYARAEGTDSDSCFTFADSASAAAAKERFLVLSREDALNLWKSADGNSVFLCDGESFVRTNAASCNVITGRGESASFSVYPKPKKVPEGWTESKKTASPAFDAGLFSSYERKTGAVSGSLAVSECASDEPGKKFRLDVSELYGRVGGHLSDCFVTLYYTGESARLYGMVAGKRTLVMDNFYIGDEYGWEISLQRLSVTGVDLSSLELEITPLKKDAKIYIESWPVISGDSVCTLHKASYAYEWTFTL
ncbi:MAG: beta-galactosidase [Treponema sp.]|nr:beta-galactosidase [Treponema sp.]